MAVSGNQKLTLASLGVTDAPVTRAGLARALAFFAMRMPSLSEDDQFDFLKGMDLHGGIREVTLAPPQPLAAFRKAGENPFKLFYTKAGTSMYALGINPSTRGFQRYRVTQPVVALESRCTGARDTWTDANTPYVASGGGLQYIVPNASQVLAVAR